MVKRYFVDKINDGTKLYYIIRDNNENIVPIETKYLTHKAKSKISPYTIRRSAYSLCYYLTYIQELEIEVIDIFEMPYAKQKEHFINFLEWLKQATHSSKKNKKIPRNTTCNMYLKDVFVFYQFLEQEYQQFGILKVLSNRTLTISNEAGVKKTITKRVFKGYLPEEEQKGKTIKKEKVITILKACTNCRDQLLILILAETGCRIGEVLGIQYTKDIDYEKRTINICYREDNENGARAKYAEYRTTLISKDTFEILMFYLSTYRSYLKDTNFLFINIDGKTKGRPLNTSGVYAILKRLEEKTQIKITPHMLRHYFANQRRKNDWDITLISKALGHRHIQTTLKYLDIETEELVEATEEYYEKNKAIFMVDELL